MPTHYFNVAEANQLTSTVYVSSARLEHEGQIEEILTAARKKNAQTGITGLLAFKDGNFLQVLEGPESAVATTLEEIRRDRRHTGMPVLSQRAIDERLFPDWSMAFHDIWHMSREDANLYSTLLVDFSLEKKAKVNPDLCYTLLLNFKKNLRYN